MSILSISAVLKGWKAMSFLSSSAFNFYLSNDGDRTISQIINDVFEPIVAAMATVLFWDPFEAFGFEIGAPVPLVVLWLMAGAIFFTIKMRFINFRGVKHAIELIQGKYDKPGDKGEVSHFQALATALSATVGLGNIAGVAIAITVGGPGATFWLIVAGLLGMTSKFTEVTLGVKYRNISDDGVVSGGPMYYLRKGLAKRNMAGLGKVLAAIFAVLIIGGSIGGGNMFQANQAFAQFSNVIPALANHGALFGVGMAILVGIVIIGGIKKIAQVTEKMVPFMALFYIATSLVIIGMNYSKIDDVFFLIINGAFNGAAIKGGFIGVLITGFQRAAFSNEAGVGSASIAHSAVKTDEPVSEGIVALLEPFIDTVVICTMTALVIVFTGFHSPELSAGMQGAEITSKAYGSVFTWFPYLLVVAIFLFAYSTMISWSYYGLKGFSYLFGRYFKKEKYAQNTYFVIFLLFVVVGSASSLQAVVDFSDMMILSLAFPNILGLLIMSGEVKQDLNAYWEGLKTGRIKKYKK